MAKRFTFRLESLLKLRNHKVEHAKEELAKVLTYKASKKNAIVEHQTEIRTFSIETKQSTLADMLAMHHRKTFLESEIVKLEHDLLSIVDIENIKVQKLQEAMKEEKVLLKLKEKQHEAFLEELKKEESLMFDEIAITRFISNEDKFIVN